jgi:hypothetical protein
MLVRGAGETFNLIVPVRRMKEWAKEQKIEWALDASKPMPKEDVINKLSIEDAGGRFTKDDDEKSLAVRKFNKEFPFRIRREFKLPFLPIDTIIETKPLDPTNFRLNLIK